VPFNPLKERAGCGYGSVQFSLFNHLNDFPSQSIFPADQVFRYWKTREAFYYFGLFGH